MKLLVVEDDADVRELVRIVLREEGHTVDTAGTATDGALMARTGDYDALVLDVRLPDGTAWRCAGRSVPGTRRSTASC